MKRRKKLSSDVPLSADGIRWVAFKIKAYSFPVFGVEIVNVVFLTVFLSVTLDRIKIVILYN